MSNIRSPLSKPSSSKRSFLSNSRHELPRWRSPSPMDESMIPPPIVESMYASPSRTVAQSIFVEKPSPLQDRQSELEADLQFLLDAQAEGLVRGLEGGLPDDQTSTGSTTPTAQSVRSASARRTPNPLRRKPGLRRARKGIFNSILALSTVKDDEFGKRQFGGSAERADTAANRRMGEKKTGPGRGYQDCRFRRGYSTSAKTCARRQTYCKKISNMSSYSWPT